MGIWFPLRLQKDKRILWTIALLVSLATFITYLPALTNGFVNWDDDEYVLYNPNIKSINIGFFKWVLTSYFFTNWHPLTIFSLAVDYSIWGLNPFGYHLTNVVLHVLNTSLVFILALKLIKLRITTSENRTDVLPYAPIIKSGLITAAVTALLFGIHPLHVESVAWVSERKDVLCAFFFLSTILAYLRYASNAKGKRLYYTLSLTFFLLALMSKAMAVTLPVALLILDLYPLERLAAKGSLKKLLTEKIPFLLLSLISSLMAVSAQESAGALVTMEQFPLVSRLFVTMHSYIFYIAKMAFPSNLAPFYPYPSSTEVFSFAYVCSAMSFVTVTILCIWKFRKNRLFSSIWLYYVATLLPVIGVVKAGEFAAADRYTYLPSLSLFLLAGIGVGALFERVPKRVSRGMVFTILLVLFGFFMSGTAKQIAVWRDSITLWNREIKLYPYVSSSYMNRGIAHRDSENYQEAITDLTKAIELNPEFAYAYYNRGFTFMDLGNYRQAIADLTKAIELSPKQYVPVAYLNRGTAYGSSGNYQQAIADFTKAIELNPKYADAHYNRGFTFLNLGDYQQAITDLTKAIELNSKLAEAYNSRGAALMGLGNYQQAVTDLTKAIELDPALAEAYNNLGAAYGELGDYQKAIEAFNNAIGINPEDKRAYYNRGMAYSELGDPRSAIMDFGKVIELDPNDATAYYSLGDAYSRMGNSQEAGIYYRRAADLGLK